MSLVKTYSLNCDSSGLSILRGTPRSVETIRHCFRNTAVPQDSSTEARRAAKHLGWVRHRETFPILPSTPSAGTSERAFDLCPNCAVALVAKEGISHV